MIPGPLDNPAVQGVHAVGGAYLTPTPQRQAAFVAGIYVAGATSTHLTVGLGVKTIQKIGTAAKIHRTTVGPVSSVLSMYSTVESIRKIRSGGHKPAFDVDYEPWDPLWVPPFPYLGDIPILRPRLTIGTEPYEQTLSRGGEHTSRSGTPSVGLSTPNPSAPPKDRSRLSSKKPVRRIPLADRRGPATWRGRRHRTPEEEILEKYYTRRR